MSSYLQWILLIKSICLFEQEHLTYDLITAMTIDFFFAYDAIQFIMLCTNDTDIYSSDWVYVCFVFAFIAMFRYVGSLYINTFRMNIQL